MGRARKRVRRDFSLWNFSLFRLAVGVSELTNAGRRRRRSFGVEEVAMETNWVLICRPRRMRLALRAAVAGVG